MSIRTISNNIKKDEKKLKRRASMDKLFDGIVKQIQDAGKELGYELDVDEVVLTCASWDNEGTETYRVCWPNHKKKQRYCVKVDASEITER